MESKQLAKLIGLPWEACARGPLSFDCWGLLHYVYKEHLGISLPEYQGADAESIRTALRLIDAGPDAHQFERVLIPENLSAVAMGAASRLHHVGVYIDVDGGKVLHCQRNQGVVFQSVPDLQKRGFARIEFYNYPHGSNI